MTAIHHCLYRFWSGDELLYVGRSVNAFTRAKQHQREKDWYEQVTHLTFEYHPDAASLVAAEASAITTERPAHNVAMPSAVPKSRPKSIADAPGVKRLWTAASIAKYCVATRQATALWTKRADFPKPFGHMGITEAKRIPLWEPEAVMAWLKKEKPEQILASS